MLDYDVLATKPRGLRLVCDQCEKRYTIYHCYSRALSKTHNFCSKACTDIARKSGGSINRKIVQTNIARFGVEYGLQNDSIIEKGRQTCLERYGVEHPLMSETQREKIKQTCLLRYGKASFLSTDACRKTLAATNVAKHGVDYPFQSAAVHEKMDYNIVALKRHETMKQNGTYAAMTKPERLMQDLLHAAFGEASVKRGYFIHKWPIDFYVETVKLFVQVDGVYWHGLDREKSVIMQLKSPRDATILKKMMIDDEQNTWFEMHELKLLRFTDKQLLLQPRCVQNEILKYAGAENEL
jgi:very-short-patch-repair endonuclease